MLQVKYKEQVMHTSYSIDFSSSFHFPLLQFPRLRPQKDKLPVICYHSSIKNEFEEDKTDWKSSLQDGISEPIPLQIGICLKNNVEFLIFNFLNRVYFSFL